MEDLICNENILDSNIDLSLNKLSCVSTICNNPSESGPKILNVKSLNTTQSIQISDVRSLGESSSIEIFDEVKNVPPVKINLVPIEKLTSGGSGQLNVNNLKRKHEIESDEEIKPPNSNEQQLLLNTKPKGRNRRKSLLTTRRDDSILEDVIIENDSSIIDIESYKQPKSVQKVAVKETTHKHKHPHFEDLKTIAFLRISVNYILEKTGKKPIVFGNLNTINNFASLRLKYSKS